MSADGGTDAEVRAEASARASASAEGGARDSAAAPGEPGKGPGGSGADAGARSEAGAVDAGEGTAEPRARGAVGEDAGGGDQAGPDASGAVDENAGGGEDQAEPGASGVEDEKGEGGDEEGEPTVRDAISAPDAQGRPRRTTRRFPLFTRDTARPEGGGRAAPGDAPAPARQWPILVVLTAVGIGLLLTALDAFRAGTVLIGVALIAGAVMRWILPSVGMLAVRSRFTDMVTYGALGVAIVLLALMAQPRPVLVIPFLDDTLHFTVR